jgi:UDP-3-O-[3-hydroxymyristoyl] glucosamine N-acyltransferase
MTRNAGELAQYLGTNLVGDARAEISGVATPEDASPHDLIYVDAPKHLVRAAESRAACALAKPGANLAGKTVIEAAHPKLAFAKAAAWLMPPARPEAGVHPAALIAPSAKVAKSATIGAYVVIEDGVSVGEKTWIEPFCFVGKDSRIGTNCRLHPHVTLYAESVLRDRVEVHSGTVIGGDGFGYVFGEGRHWKFPQAGKVVLEDDVEIGCNTAVDRGSLGTTRIGSGAKIDNLVQVAHNVRIGEHTILVSQTGISGSTTLGKYVVVGGQAGFGDHAVVEDNAIIGGQAGILPGKVVRSGQVVWGTPCRPLDKFKEQHAWFGRLPELARRLKALEEQVGKSGPSNS